MTNKEYKEQHEYAAAEKVGGSDVFADLMGAALSEVNWRRIAQHLVDAVEIEETVEDPHNERLIMKTITLKFADSDDLKSFQKYLGMAKAQEGTVTGLYCGLMCSALKRSETIPNHSPELLEACKFILSQLDQTANGSQIQCKLYSDCLAPDSTDDDKTVVDYLRDIVTKAEGNA